MSVTEKQVVVTDADVEAAVRVYVRYHKAARWARKLLDDGLRLHGRSERLLTERYQGTHQIPGTSCLYTADGTTIEVRDTNSASCVGFEIDPQPGDVRRHLKSFMRCELDAGHLDGDVYQRFLDDRDLWEATAERVYNIFDPNG